MPIAEFDEKSDLEELIDRAIKEDLGPSGDITSQTVIPEDATLRAHVKSRGHYIASGIGVARAVFDTIDPSLSLTSLQVDGEEVEPGDALIAVSGSARSILTAERTALNFLQRLTGIATLARQYVDAVKPHDVSILDTRKTTPGWRTLEKHAVMNGGGENHRFGLFDRFLIKDNHLACRHDASDLDFAEWVARCRAAHPDCLVEIEVDTFEQFEKVLEARPDWILLDNMDPDLMKTCVERNGDTCRLEASGGITLDKVEAIAASGVHAISVGALTHSAPAADLGLDYLGSPVS
jgi:nicotinate-nucleotide pyrophosphorylase (carboxylating)